MKIGLTEKQIAMLGKAGSGNQSLRQLSDKDIGKLNMRGLLSEISKIKAIE